MFVKHAIGSRLIYFITLSRIICYLDIYLILQFQVSIERKKQEHFLCSVKIYFLSIDFDIVLI